MAIFPPIALFILPVVWLAIVAVGFSGIFWALGVGDARAAITMSGSSLVTLGFAVPQNLTVAIFAVVDASIGLLLLALLIAYLPTIYGAFSRREVQVNLLEVRAGNPPSAVELITRFYRLGRFDKLDDLWESWETWFAELEETHTSFGMLAFFRSSQPDHSWVTATGAILDAASLMTSAVNYPRTPQAQLTIRAGFIALRRIADYFRVPYEPIVSWSDPISITREEFDDACAELAGQGVPLLEDREKAWRDFVGWRVNYDMVLLALATLTIAPYAPWSSDRARMPVVTGPPVPRITVSR
jgi:hypothetical protein